MANFITENKTEHTKKNHTGQKQYAPTEIKS